MKIKVKFLTTGDVAKICAVAPRTAAKWIDTGQLEGWVLPGSRERRTSVEQLLSFMHKHKMPDDQIYELGFAEK